MKSYLVLNLEENLKKKTRSRDIRYFDHKYKHSQPELKVIQFDISCTQEENSKQPKTISLISQ